MPTNRILSAAAALLAIGASFTGAAQAQTQIDIVTLKAAEIPQDYAFEILRKGKKIGTHYIRFSSSEEGLKVDIDITIKVKIGPITVYAYQHNNSELWREGQLRAIETKTDENGKDHFISGVATSEGFKVNSKSGEILLPAGIMPTSYWQTDFTDNALLLDTQRGTALNVIITEQSYDESVTAAQYRVAGDLKLDLWYGEDRLRKLTFDNGGTLIEYRVMANDGH